MALASAGLRELAKRCHAEAAVPGREVEREAVRGREQLQAQVRAGLRRRHRGREQAPEDLVP